MNSMVKQFLSKLKLFGIAGHKKASKSAHLIKRHKSVFDRQNKNMIIDY